MESSCLLLHQIRRWESSTAPWGSPSIKGSLGSLVNCPVFSVPLLVLLSGAQPSLTLLARSFGGGRCTEKGG